MKLLSWYSSPLPWQFELALGQFPYPTWKNVFEQLKYVVEGEPPQVPADANFSTEFKEFIHLWWVEVCSK